MNRRLYRCRHDRRLAGVAAGVAEFFDLDPTLVRVLWFLSIFVGGLGILLYVGLALIVPLEPLSEADAAREAAQAPGTAEGHRHVVRDRGRWVTVLGVALILFGTLAFLDSSLPAWADLRRYVVPVVTVAIGIVLVVAALRRDPMQT